MYTKGKWEIDVSSQCYFEIKANGVLICHTPGDPQYLGYPPEEAQANAHLIAAAPELLEACREAQKAISLLYECNPKVEIALGSGLQLKKAEGLIKAAIAKAES